MAHPRKVNIPEVLDRLEDRFGAPRMIARFSPMDELISCILSQHSADARSFPAFTNLLETFPTWEQVAQAPLENLAEAIRGAGLANQKSKSIQRSLRLIYDKFGDYTLEPLRKWPTSEAREWLKSLPGVGPKTASIVLCFAMGRETIPVDTHVFRVSWRMGIIDESDDEVKAHDILMKRVPSDMAFRYHTTLIQHGRMICRAPVPKCEICPVQSHCREFKRRGKK